MLVGEECVEDVFLDFCQLDYVGDGRRDVALALRCLGGGVKDPQPLHVGDFLIGDPCAPLWDHVRHPLDRLLGHVRRGFAARRWLQHAPAVLADLARIAREPAFEHIGQPRDRRLAPAQARADQPVDAADQHAVLDIWRDRIGRGSIKCALDRRRDVGDAGVARVVCSGIAAERFAHHEARTSRLGAGERDERLDGSPGGLVGGSLLDARVDELGELPLDILDRRPEAGLGAREVLVEALA